VGGPATDGRHTRGRAGLRARDSGDDSAALGDPALRTRHRAAPVDLVEASASSTAPATRTLTIGAPSGLRFESVTVARRDRDPARAVILGPSRAVRVFAYPAPVDRRK
jgi:hypothetical protein